MSTAEIPPPHPVSSEDVGLIEKGLRALFGASWRTTVFGLLTIAGGILPLVPNVPTWVGPVMVSVTAGLGLMFSKDGRVTGGSHKNTIAPPPPPA